MGALPNRLTLEMIAMWVNGKQLESFWVWILSGLVLTLLTSQFVEVMLAIQWVTRLFSWGGALQTMATIMVLIEIMTVSINNPEPDEKRVHWVLLCVPPLLALIAAPWADSKLVLVAWGLSNSGMEALRYEVLVWLRTKHENTIYQSMDTATGSISPEEEIPVSPVDNTQDIALDLVVNRDEASEEARSLQDGAVDIIAHKPATEPSACGSSLNGILVKNSAYDPLNTRRLYLPGEQDD